MARRLALAGERLAQRLRKIAGRLEPRRRVYGQRIPQDLNDRRRYVEAMQLLPVERAVEDDPPYLRQTFARRRRFTGQKFKENQAQREDIGPPIERATPVVFRAHVARRAVHALLALARFRRGGEAGQPEIHDPDALIAVEHQVVRREVEMRDLVRVRHAHALEHLHEEPDRIALRNGAAPLHLLLEGRSLYEFEHQKRRLAVHPDLIQGNDVGMSEAGDGAGLGQKFGVIGLIALRAQQQLDRHLPFQLGVPGQIDPPVVATPKLGAQFETTKTRRFGLRHIAGYRSPRPRA